MCYSMKNIFKALDVSHIYGDPYNQENCIFSP